MTTSWSIGVVLTLQTFWAAQILYKFTINLTKTSICLLYLRIFPSIKFRRTVYVVLAYVLLYAFASIIATIVQCVPLARIWDHNVNGSCINLTAFWYANAAANIFGDFLILGLPMPVIRSLHLPQRQRCGLILVFALGGLYVHPTLGPFGSCANHISVCITSILRMTTLKTGSKATDQTYGTLNSTIWTTIEANTGIICASLPMLKGPLAAIFPGLFPRGSSGSNEYSGGSASYRRRAANSGPRNSPAHTYGGWGRLESNRQGAMNIASPSAEKATPSKASRDNSSDDIFVTPGQDIPMGHITKTTRLDVQYGRENTKPGSQRSRRNSQDHVRSLSEAHLVGKDFVFP